MASYSLELDLQDPWFRPFTVHAELDRAHDGVKGRASCVCPKAGVVESPCRFDRLSNEGPKRVRHPKAGVIALEYSTFAVDGRPDLSLVIYNPATPKDAEKIRSLVKPRAAVRPQRLVARPRP